ncbi:pyrroline-5-carboxylate reductase [Candidatus Woesearchaeota archaeon]|nr:pyrroline-5-carboxylate reductase [Candidatus Woesearchaeota archaeon]
MRLGFIGAGNMASAMMQSVLNKGVCAPGDIICSDVNPDAVSRAGQLGVRVTMDNALVVKESDIVVIAVKPQVVAEVVDKIVDSDDIVFISIAAGIKLSAFAGKLRKVVRLMPNTPCLVGEMAGGYAVGEGVGADDVLMVRKVLDACGVAFKMEESMLDAVTGLSGSGPAFVARMIEWYAAAGVRNGLDQDAAYQLALKTFLGTSKLLTDMNMTPEELVKMVSSPGGTTVAGREVLEGSDVAEVLGKTVSRATERSRELGK